MVDILKNTLRTNIVSYQMLAQKAVSTDSSQTGVVAALERFFYKLEFLLKNGYFPTKDDAKGENLPPELCGLRVFLNTGNKKGSYVLQKDTATRYRFKYSQRDEGRIDVIEEKLDISQVTPLYANHIGIASWKLSCEQTCEKTELLSDLHKSAFPQECQFSNGFQTKTYDSFGMEEDFNNELLHRPPFSSFKVTGTTSISELTEAINNAIQSVKKESFDYLLSGKINSARLNTTTFFHTCIEDLMRYTTTNYTINGVKIHQETLVQIMNAIVPDGKLDSTNVNTTPLNTRDSYSQIEQSLNHLYGETDAAKISAILQKPQFPLALLALVCQMIPTLSSPSMLNDVKFETNVSRFPLLKGLDGLKAFEEIKYNARKYDIRMDKEGNLCCGVESFYPYIGSTDEIGLSRVYSCFPVPQNFVGNANLHDKLSIANKLDELLPQIETGVIL